MGGSEGSKAGERAKGLVRPLAACFVLLYSGNTSIVKCELSENDFFFYSSGIC